MDRVEPSLPLRWPPARAGVGDRPVWLVLSLALVLLVTTGSRPGGETLAAMIAVASVLAISVRWSVAPLALAVLVVVGVGLRAAIQIHFGSDVIDVVASAIRHVEFGQNPYGFGYDQSRPPGAPYAYGPLALLWYGPLQNDGWQLELLMACGVLTALAMRGKLLGLAIYAVGPTLVATSGDGSNDTSAGALLLVTFIVARRHPRLGALLLAASVAFKPYAAAWAPAFFVWGGWWTVAIFVAASFVLWSPVLFVWGVGSFLASLDLADRIHHNTYWSIAELWESVVHHDAPKDLFNQLRIALGTITAVATLRWARSLDGVILAGALVYLITLYFGYWSTYAYFGAIAPILCWRIDDWIGIPSRPLVNLPGDRPPGPLFGQDDREVAAT